MSERKRRTRRGRQPSTFDREAIREEATPVLERWQSSADLFEVRRRLRGVLGAGLVVGAVQFLLNPGGLASLLVTLWFLLSVPVVAIAACVLVLLKDPANAPEMWWENGAVATVGLVSLAGFARVARVTPLGRAAWQLLFGSDHPTESDYEFGTGESEVDLSAVARFRRYVWYAIVVSAGIVLVEGTIRHDVFGAGVFEGLLGIDPGPVAWVGLFLALAVLGFGIGVLGAAMDM